MDAIPVDIDHAEHSVGGAGGHWFRRLTHVGMCVIPFAYHLWGDSIAGKVSMTPSDFVIAVAVFFIVIEVIRIKFGIIIIGQREYEAKQVSALAWGAVAVCLTLILAPQEGEGLEAGKYTIPIICGLTFVDPIMGEVKRAKMGMQSAVLVGLAVSYTIWMGSVALFSTPFLVAVLLAPLTVAGEVPRVSWIDDNATMILFPLIALLLLHPLM
ncbi:TPA: hypothetical protein HA325_02505 [Candidatus Thalassarchaeaceae archaeon]|jgi:hypothetical protein|nr:hypothetical protein [Euryarchaeota archaeon]DAC66807.1 MAG TPA: hypothetical protein D7I15_02500 [Candidatus Poseidoniales archaeon]HII43474.1 hypothetical protein [Candidatus Thalassarchaeaceae archaeon]|tara:strand:- start:8933 stop:9568 length:636 start_codon:yes stop_codon:yes gene_type:complete